MVTEISEVSRLEQANTLGLAYLKTMILLNGGAILAVLTFLGNASAQAAMTIPLEAVKCSITALLVGITAMMIALILSYSYTAAAPETGWSRFWDKWIILFNSACSIISLIAFIRGVTLLVGGAVEAT